MIDIYKNQRVLKRQNAIWTFTIIALVFIAIKTLRNFFHITTDNAIVWNFSVISLINSVLYVSSYVLFALYVFKFCRKNWSSIILASAISLLVLLNLNDTITYIISFVHQISPFTMLDVLFNFVTVSFEILLIIGLFVGLKQNKMTIMLLCIIRFVYALCSLIIILPYARFFSVTFIVDFIIIFIANVAFYVALLILGTSNKILALKNKNRV